MDLDDARTSALAFPGATEEPHFDLTSFRVRGKIFATAPPHGDELRIFVDEPETAACLAENPRAFAELRWGTSVSGVRVTLSAIDAARIGELLEESWRRRAPKRLIAEWDRHHG